MHTQLRPGEDPVGPQPKPIFHEEYLVGQYVQLKGMGDGLDGLKGKIVGIAMAHIAFSYIIKLDKPLPAPPEYPGEDWECVAILGGFFDKIEKDE